MDAGLQTPTLADFARLLQQLNQIATDPELQAQLGPGLIREIRYPMATFRQRFPNEMPSAQPQFF